MSRRLVQLDADAPLPRPIEELVAKSPDPARLSGFLEENGFRSLLARLGVGAGDASPRFRPPPAAPAAPIMADPQATPFGPYECVTTLAQLDSWIAEARAAGVIGLDTETDSLDALAARLVGVCLATAPGRACYVPLRHAGGDMLSPDAGADPFDDAIAACGRCWKDACGAQAAAQRQV
jgi:DNA polymerase-1